MIIALQRLRRLHRDTSGLAMMEFAFTCPIILAMGGYGVELSFLALTNLRVSQYAVNLADNASRVGVVAGAGVTLLREADINDVLQGTRKEGELIKLTTNGRVTLSSLENVQRTYLDGTTDAGRVQRIHWQRCIGVMGGAGYDSPYKGNVSPTAGTSATQANRGYDVPGGMGPVGKTVSAHTDSGVMYVEVSYRYKPLFGSLFVSPQVISYTQSYVVRDNRDFTKVHNPTPSAPVQSCDKYTV